MRHGWTGYLFGGVLALAVPCVALCLATSTEQNAQGLIVAPFAWPRLLIVHLLTALPLALLTAADLRRGGRAWAWGWALFGVALAALTVVYGAALSDAPRLKPAGFLLGAIIRFAWCFFLELPWCVLALHLAAAPPLVFNRWAALGLGLLVALGVPTAYGRDLVLTQSQKLQESLRQGRMNQSLMLAETLTALGSYRAVPGLPDGPLPPEKILGQLKTMKLKYLDQLARPIDDNTPPRVRLERIKRLASLDRVEDAEVELALLPQLEDGEAQARVAALQEQLQLLHKAIRPLHAENKSPLNMAVADAVLRRAKVQTLLANYTEIEKQLADAAFVDIETTLLRAAVWQLQKKWEESSEQYGLALKLLERAAPQSRQTIEGQVRAYNGLAFNARGRHAFTEAEEAYLEALKKVPQARAHFHFELGTHYQQGGRPADAFHHLEIAGKLEPVAYGDQTRSMLDNINMYTPGCFLRGVRP